MTRIPTVDAQSLVAMLQRSNSSGGSSIAARIGPAVKHPATLGIGTVAAGSTGIALASANLPQPVETRKETVNASGKKFVELGHASTGYLSNTEANLAIAAGSAVAGTAGGITGLNMTHGVGRTGMMTAAGAAGLVTVGALVASAFTTNYR